MVDSFRDFIKANSIWIISTLVFIGAVGNIINCQTKQIEQLQADSKVIGERLVIIDRTSIRLDNIEKALAEIKVDVKEIRTVIFKPITSNTQKEVSNHKIYELVKFN